MSFSIITASFNSMPFIIHCVNSLGLQRNIEFEHIIVDGNSSDGTREFLEQTPNIRFISEKDKGIYDALNKGYALARNDYIGVLHTDDFFVDEMVLSDIQELFLSGADVVYADLDYVSREVPDKLIRKWKSGLFDYRDLKFGWMPPHPTMFIKKEVFTKIGEYDLQYKVSSDYDFMLRVLKEKTLRISYLPRTIVRMRMGGVSNKRLFSKMQEDYSIMCKNFPSPFGTLLIKNLRKIGQFV